MPKLIIPIPGQHFNDLTDWVANGKAQLTNHPEHRNTEHIAIKGWNGAHFTALCYDQQGRRCRDGSDFQRAQAEKAYPIWYVWPDQIAQLVVERFVYDDMAHRLAEQLHELADTMVPVLTPMLDNVPDQTNPVLLRLRGLLQKLKDLK